MRSGGEMVDTRDLKSLGSFPVPVRVRSRAIVSSQKTLQSIEQISAFISRCDGKKS